MKKTKLKTVTLFHGANPSAVVCPGHVGVKEFNDAFKNEGWSDRGRWAWEDISYGYCTTNKRGQYVQVAANKKGARPYTWVSWD